MSPQPGEAVIALLMSRFRSSATTGASYVQAWFESGPEPFRSTISPVKSEGLYHLSYRPTQGGLCPKRTRTERNQPASDTSRRRSARAGVARPRGPVSELVGTRFRGRVDLASADAVGGLSCLA